MCYLVVAIHIGAHVFNVERLFVAHNSDDADMKGLLSALSNLDDNNPRETFVNPVRDSTEVGLVDRNGYL